MTLDMTQFHQVFLDESFERLDIIESGLLHLAPGRVDAEQINAILRAAHSIKGGSGTFGFMDVSGFTHVIETLLDEMRNGCRPVTVDAVNVLLDSVDVLRAMLTAARDGVEPDGGRVSAQQAELARLLAGRDCAGMPARGVAGRVSGPAISPAADVGVAPVGWRIILRSTQGRQRAGDHPLHVIRALALLGDLQVACDGPVSSAAADCESDGSCMVWDLRLNAPIDRGLIDDALDPAADDDEVVVVPILPGATSPTTGEVRSADRTAGPRLGAVPVPADRRVGDERRLGEERRKRAASAGSGSPGSIRVDIEKIDSLVRTVDELIAAQSMLDPPGADVDPRRVEHLSEGLENIERLTRELRDSVMRMRMEPLSASFSRFPRLVHDLGMKLGKKIELKMSGEHTEVDKVVIEKIGDPLLHMIRNSVDHGIEEPGERLAVGKPETGTVHLDVFYRDGHMLIEVRDDGRGLPREKILDLAVERGMVDPDKPLSERDIHELILQPGFSTAQKVTDVSGRGVGMDIVRRNVNELGGTIDIESLPGEGTSIFLRLPLAPTVLAGDVVRIGKATCVVPLESIVESVRVEGSRLKALAGGDETFPLRKEHLPVVRLHDLFGSGCPDAQHPADAVLVVVESEGRKCALYVDELLDKRQMAVRSPVSSRSANCGVRGTAILTDGSLAPIVDINALLRLAGHRGASDQEGLAVTG